MRKDEIFQRRLGRHHDDDHDQSEEQSFAFELVCGEPVRRCGREEHAQPCRQYCDKQTVEEPSPDAEAHVRERLVVVRKRAAEPEGNARLDLHRASRAVDEQ